MESVLIPHGNETKVLRQMQDEICRTLALAPALPISIRGIEPPKVGERIAGLRARGLSEEDGTVFLNVRAEFAGAGCAHGNGIRAESGRIDIGRRLRSIPQNSPRTETPLPSVREIAFPVVQSAQVERTRSGIAEEWTVRRGRWIKCR